MKTYAIDYETSYTKTRGIRQLGVRGYLSHKETDIYLMSVYGPDFAWVGNPRDFDWSVIAGAQWVSHNASFDSEVFAELSRRGTSLKSNVPPFPSVWNCTADCAAYLQSPRSLLDASRELLGLQLDKSVRAEMEGKDFHTLSTEDKARWAEYAMLDAKASWLLWDKFSSFWPEHERAVSRHTAMMGQRGIGIDLRKLTQGIEILKQSLFECEQRIPWSGELTEKGKEIPLTSPKAMAEECRRIGVEPPASTDAKSEEFEAWLDENEAKADFILAMQEYRRANRLLTVLEAMKDRSIGDRLYYGLKYFGAATGRWSGDTGLNLQNLPRKAVSGVDVRACLVPGPGKKFVIADLAQIEPRVLHWITGNTAWLDLVRSGMSPYEAHGRTSKCWSGGELKKENPELYLNCKVEVLGLGYGAGGTQYRKIAKLMGGLELTDAQAKQAVDSFRRSNKRIVGLWDQLDRALRDSRGGDFDMELPSGRTISYFGVAASGREVSARILRGGTRLRWWGSKLCENLIQATARDVFADIVLRLEAAGLPVVLTIHDEAVLEVDADSAEEAKAEALRIMSEPPAWAEGLPVAAEAHICDRYGK